MKFPDLAQFEAAPIVAAEVATGPGSAVQIGALSLRAKGLLVFAALVVYVTLVAVLMTRQWHQSLVVAAQVRELDVQEVNIERLESSAAHAILELQGAPSPQSPSAAALDIDLLLSEAAKLTAKYPTLARIRDRLRDDIAQRNAKSAPGPSTALSENLNEMSVQARAISEQVHKKRQTLSETSRQLHESIAITGLAVGLLGVIALGTTMALFLARLRRDIRQLESHAVDIVNGYRGAPLEVTRRDELGTLMKAVNRMQSELRQREQQAEISREQRFHQEKMAAMGSVAAAVAHEINNPIAAITGIAQQMDDARRGAGCAEALCRPELILEHTRRIASISRQLSEMTAPHSQEPELLDINGLVRSTANFIVYDKRFRGIGVALDLDPGMPAIHAVSDHVTQVLMNLLINSADALQGVNGRTPAIRVATRAGDGEVTITVEDNGHGMDRSLLSKVFQESFTTKPPDRGRGLGLFLCKTLIEQAGGRIELQSAPDAGTTARIRMPVPRAAQS